MEKNFDVFICKIFCKGRHISFYYTSVSEKYGKVIREAWSGNTFVENCRTLSSMASISLSAGEKQLMVISLLWALAICSKKKLPVIIDTPLSRLDSAHRVSLIQTYFPQASEQTIILSTDSEIDHTYYNMMKESVGDEFTLSYSEETKSTSIEKGYFREL